MSQQIRNPKRYDRALAQARRRHDRQVAKVANRVVAIVEKYCRDTGSRQLVSQKPVVYRVLARNGAVGRVRIYRLDNGYEFMDELDKRQQQLIEEAIAYAEQTGMISCNLLDGNRLALSLPSRRPVGEPKLHLLSAGSTR